MSRPRRLLLVTQRPLDFGGGGSVRWQYLRDELPRHGWEVDVVSSAGNATSNEISTDPRRARLAERRATVMAVAGAVLRPVARAARLEPEALAPNNLWAITGRRPIRARLERGDVDAVVCTCPPPSALLAAVSATREARTPLVADLRDLWAGNPFLDRGSEVLRRVEGRAFAHADAVVTVTQRACDRLVDLHPEIAGKLQLIRNGFHPALLERRRPASAGAPAGRTPVLIHAGSLYGDRTADLLVHALGRAELGRPVHLRLVGTVDARTRAAAQEAPAGVEVTVEPPVSWDEAIDATVSADVAVILNSPGLGGDLALPSKLFEALALGRPILAITPPDSEMADLLRSLGLDAGIAPFDDPAAIAAATARLLADPPPAVPAERLTSWNRAHGAKQFATLLDRVVSARRG